MEYVSTSMNWERWLTIVITSAIIPSQFMNLKNVLSFVIIKSPLTIYKTTVFVLPNLCFCRQRQRSLVIKVYSWLLWNSLSSNWCQIKVLQPDMIKEKKKGNSFLLYNEMRLSPQSLSCPHPLNDLWRGWEFLKPTMSSISTDGEGTSFSSLAFSFKCWLPYTLMLNDFFRAAPIFDVFLEEIY